MVMECVPWILARGEGRVPVIMLRSQRDSMNSETYVLLVRRFYHLAYVVT